MTPIESYYEKTAASLIRNLEKRGFEACYCADKESASAKALEMIKEGSCVTWGGSLSIAECGLTEALDSEKYHILDRTKAKDREEMMEIYRRAFSADYYLMSTNAITKEGELVNVDGNGNRVAALIFGPKQVIILAGMNKVVDDVDTALKRIRHLAAPVNAMRLKRSTPCAGTGACADCLSPDCICSHTVVTRRSGIPGRIKVILVGETLGY